MGLLAIVLALALTPSVVMSVEVVHLEQRLWDLEMSDRSYREERNSRLLEEERLVVECKSRCVWSMVPERVDSIIRDEVAMSCSRTEPCHIAWVPVEDIP